jgi:F0F1-type ATP synthase assembly protein I
VKTFTNQWGEELGGTMTSHQQDDGERRVRSDLAAAGQGIAQGSEAMDFISSILAGLLLGSALDWWLDTNPVFVIIGIVLGFIAGFYKLWRASAVLEEQAERRRRD